MTSGIRKKGAAIFLAVCMILIITSVNVTAASTAAASASGGSRYKALGITVNETTHTVSVFLSGTVIQSLMESTGDTVIVNIPFLEDTKNYEAELPVTCLTSNNAKRIELVTPRGSLIIPDSMFTGRIEGTTAAICIKEGDKSTLPEGVLELLGENPVLELGLCVDGRQTEWNNPDSPVFVIIPYLPTAAELFDPQHIVVVYIDGSGDAVLVPNGRYDPENGTLTFSVTRFGGYAAAFVQKSFSDLGNYAWAKVEIEALASKGVINGTSQTTFSPAEYITRADFLVMLVKALGLSASVDSNFSDVSASDYFFEAVAIAKKLGITTGSGNYKFNPKAGISRQDLMTLTARALEKHKGFYVSDDTRSLAAFGDSKTIAFYAVNSVAALLRAGLIEGIDGEINPLGKITRAQAAVFLYGIYNLY